ncbi:glucosamine inositolphosphorylceramide transferase family protein [Anaerotignum sp.]
MSLKVSKLWLKLFYSPYYFTIALRRSCGQDVCLPVEFTAEHVIPATFKKWAADPILVDDQDKTYLFYEAVHNDKGRIEVARVNEDCSLSEPIVILEDDCHYSYPLVFRWNREWYMIPESSASNEVRLYKAIDFPVKWENTAVLLRQASVDTTVFEQDGQLYLLTYMLCLGTERVKPQAYRLFLDGEGSLLQPMRWEKFNELECRGAGPLIAQNGNLIRPAQKNEEQSYGNGLLFYRVQTKENEYSETCLGTLEASQVKVDGVWMNGLHTYAKSAHFEAIDIRCREFDFWKIPRVLWNKLRRILIGGKQ